MSEFATPSMTNYRAHMRAQKKRTVVIYAAYQVIKKSGYAQQPKCWHWALLENIANEGDGLPDPNSTEYLEGLSRACDLAAAVWTRYYAPRGTKRKVPDDVENLKETKVPSLTEMATSGLSFKLDWNSQNMGVTVFQDHPEFDKDITAFKTPQKKMKCTSTTPLTVKTDVRTPLVDRTIPLPIEDPIQFESPNQKENERLIAKPSSIRARIMRRIFAKLDPSFK
ncbi:hypothetical protein TWF696_007882 [Orbilia brochopaga]|uniref:Uncharacterized protein n=1 Tax=Orbilia brochopaga TaxID=3140254 RepID=A0AAV9UMB9_9PEZI